VVAACVSARQVLPPIRKDKDKYIGRGYAHISSQDAICCLYEGKARNQLGR
jgi:hypothetical protein